MAKAASWTGSDTEERKRGVVWGLSPHSQHRCCMAVVSSCREVSG